jgi:outer membrane protein
MKLFVAVAFNLTCVLLMGAWLYQGQQPRTAYIQSYDVYEAFDGRKELQQRFENEVKQEKIQLDSMKLYLEQMPVSTNVSAEDQQRVKGLWTAYRHKQQNYQQRYDERSTYYNDQIWKQINTYVQEYGKEQGYRYIFGASGNGSLMYGSEGENISKAVIKFVNLKYQGK